MSDWLVVLSEDNWEACRDAGLLGAGRRAQRRLEQMIEGDRVWIYVNKKYVDRPGYKVERIRALARVAGPLQRLARAPWRARGEETFPLARPIEVQRRLDIPAGQLLRQLSFVRKPASWGLYLRQAPLRLVVEDVRQLEAAAQST